MDPSGLLSGIGGAVQGVGNALGNITGLVPNSPPTPGFSGGQINQNSSTNLGNGTAYIPGQGFINTTGQSNTGPSYNPQVQGSATGPSGSGSPSNTTNNTNGAIPPGNPNANQQVSPYFDQANNILQSAYNGIQGLQGDLTNQWNSFNTSGKSQVDTQTGQQLGTIQGQQTDETNRAVNARSQAQSDANSLMQNQLAGGTSTGVSGFLAGLIGKQANQQTGNINTAWQSSMQKLDTARQNVQQWSQSAKDDIDFKTQAGITQAKTTLQDQLTQISQSQSGLQGQRASLAYNAIQSYQNLVAQFNQANAAMKNQLAVAEQYAHSNLSNLQQQFTQNMPGTTNFGNFQIPWNQGTGASAQPMDAGQQQSTNLFANPQRNQTGLGGV